MVVFTTDFGCKKLWNALISKRAASAVAFRTVLGCKKAGGMFFSEGGLYGTAQNIFML